MTDFSAFPIYAVIALIVGLLAALLWSALFFDSETGRALTKSRPQQFYAAAGLSSIIAIGLIYIFGLLDFKPIRDFLISSSYLMSFVLGSLFGLTELVSRYRDDPRRALRSRAAFLYVLINALASAFALNYIRVFDLFNEGEPMQIVFKRVLIAGLGAMLLFRSSLFIVRVGNSDIGFGPVFILQILLRAADRAVDRKRGRARSVEVAEIMKEISFNKAKALLPAVCLALLQNLSKEEQEELAREVADIDKANILLSDEKIVDRQKSVLLGLALLDIVGTDLLKQAVASLGNDIKIDGKPPDGGTD